MMASITKPLTLYLGTEILFSLAGYNGEIFHQFACDFFEQVRLANTGATPTIVLRYFADIKKGIDDFFRAYLKTKYSCTISTKSKWKQDGQKQERTQQAYHSV